MPEQLTDTPLLTARYALAFALAMQVHGRQVRKGGSIPYLTHLMTVSSLALENGGDEDIAIAGLLHDTIEDGEDGAALRHILQFDFGDRVLQIVDGCTEWVAVPGQKKPPWRDRKEKYLAHITDETHRDVLLVGLCDKLHNARTLLSDYKAIGDELWSRFNASRDDQLWYYRSLAETFGKRYPGPLTDELTRLVDELGAGARRSDT